MSDRPAYRRHALLAFLLYLTFVVYGSLVPFEYRAYTLEQALNRFANIPWLNLGAASRADWVANLVLYIPLAFLACTLFGAARSAFIRHARSLLVLLLCLAVAVGVEFTQIFFAPRTVSLNDLLAEAIGTLVGIAIWSFGHDGIHRLWLDFVAGGRRSLAGATAAFALLYIGLGLFPYDFVVSAAELGERIGRNAGWILASWNENALRVAARLLGEALAIAPLGLFAGLLASRVSLRRAFIAGALLGLLLELAQLLLVSGVSQGASILARGAGMAAGAWLGVWVHEHGLLPLARWVRRLGLPALALYLPALFALSGWLRAELVPASKLGEQLAQVQWLPFWYHYYTTEPVALASLLANLGFYAPLGILAWARQSTIPRLRRRGMLQPMLWATVLATMVEASKLWLVGNHPDPTNVLIGASGAALAFAAAMWLAKVATQDALATPAVEASANASEAEHPKASRPHPPLPPVWAATLATAALIFALAGLWAHPLNLPWVLILTVGYGLVLWRWPWAWIGLLPAALPVLDLAPYSGRLLIDEFDLLILLSIAAGYWRIPIAHKIRAPGKLLQLAYGLLLVSGLIATAPGLLAFVEHPSATIDSSHSPLDALLIGKGVLWALWLTPLLLYLPQNALRHAQGLLVSGLAGGLALLSLLVVWERHMFVGLGDFSDVFRVTGGFSTMFSGGAYIEAYIALAFPALLIWTLQQADWLRRGLGLLFAALASYAMMVTFSRGGYAGLVLGAVALAWLLWRGKGSRRQPRWLLAGLLLAAGLAATPVMLGEFAQQRIGQAAADLQVRLGLWRNAWDIMDRSAMASGMGFGQYPTQYLWHSNPDKPPGTFSIQREGERQYLRLGGGEPYYLDQIVDIDPSKSYFLLAGVRFNGNSQKLTIALCEKALLYSFKCNTHLLKPLAKGAAQQWHTLGTLLNTEGLGDSHRWPQRTLKLSLAGPAEGSIDVDLVSIVQSGTTYQLDNYHFTQGLAHWMPAIDFDPPWHIHQTLLEVFYAQGLLGITALILTLVSLRRALNTPLRDGQQFAIAIAAGTTGFLAVGLLGSTLDTARLLFLFYFIAVGGSALATTLPTETRTP